MEMKTLNEFHIEPVDIHAAIARAHIDRGEYIRLALLKLPALVKGVAAKRRPSRSRGLRTGACA
jgi:hypothetical protein